MTSRPNFLFILTDQQRFDTLGCNGNPVIQTPELDRLAAEGVNLTNLFVQSPMCMPSRAALATGRYPSVNGARWNGIGLPATERTFMQVLREHGCHTALFGKLHLLPHVLRQRDDLTFGFDEAVIAEHPRPHWASAYSDWLREHHPEHEADGRLRTYSEELEIWVPARPVETHLSTWIGDETVRFLKSRPPQPFFASMSFYDPHHPFDPPEPYASMYDPKDVPQPIQRPGELADKPPHFLDGHHGRVNPIIGFSEPPARGGPATPQPDLSKVTPEQWGRVVAHYYGMVSLIDRQVGRALSALREAGLEQNTVVIFTSDHGELLGDHGLLFKGPHHYDCLLRVPTLARWPGRLPAGRRVDGLVEMLDLPATILEMAGIEPPLGMQGRSLMPLLEGAADDGRESVLVERQDLYWRLDVRTLRTHRWKLNYYANRPFGELFDLENDPQEFVNLWDDPGYATAKQELVGALLDRVIAAADPLPSPTAAT